ncbi:hypothetical protein DVH24_010878, partial [Malus domestica]
HRPSIVAAVELLKHLVEQQHFLLSRVHPLYFSPGQPTPLCSKLFNFFHTNYLKIPALKHLRSLTHPSGIDAPKPLHHFERLLVELIAIDISPLLPLTFSTMMMLEFRIMIHPEQGRICCLCQQGGKVRYSFRYVIIVAWHFPRTFNCCCIVEYIKNDAVNRRGSHQLVDVLTHPMCCNLFAT